MIKPLVTIAIPTFNRADRYLKKSLESALKQTYQNIEILVSDNCSTDNTEDLIRSYKDSRIKYFKQKENLGQRGNSNFLLYAAKGEYFLLFHDDDLIDYDFVETCIRKVNYRSNVGVIMSGSRMINQKGEPIQESENHSEGLSIDEFILSWYKCKVNIFLCCTLFNTEILKRIGGFENKYNHYDDVAANFKCTHVAGRADLPEIKASLRSHCDSVTNTTEIEMWSRDALALLELAYSLAPGKNKEIKKIGMQQSAKNVYMFADAKKSKSERLKCFWKVYKTFGYKYLPPLKHCNHLVPYLGYILHPYKGMSNIKSALVSNLKK